MTGALASVVDLDRYPIQTSDSAEYGSLVGHCRAALADDGCCRLARFLRPETIATLEAAAPELEPFVHTRTEPATIYGELGPATLPDDHPRRVQLPRGGGFVPADKIDPRSPLWTIFHNAAMTRFIADAFDQPQLYPYADPLASMAINSMRAGDEFPWHFDTNDITVSIMVTAPEAGGVFEYVPHIRTDQAQNYDAVQAVVDGDHRDVRRLTLGPGDIQLFSGRNTLHRVTPVEGNATRNVALPAWSTTPHHVGTLERAVHSYGRALPIHHAAARGDHQTVRTLLRKGSGSTE